MNFFNYSEGMEADLKSLEEKISKLISLCSNLREENSQLLGDLSQARQAADALKSKMLLASNKLEGLLETMPNSPAENGANANASADIESFGLESQ
jgi:cell division protein ZapB